MIKIFKNILLLLVLTACTFTVKAQSTTSSPYSQFGIGLIRGSSLPQNRSLAGLSAGMRRASGFYDINISNPASYSSIGLTTFDIGAFGSIARLEKGDRKEKNFDASLNHLAFAVPVNRKSALSFGLLPYSQMGFSQNRDSILGSDTANLVYSGEGGVSKAYLGYGFQVGKHLSFGVNAGYLFGKLSKTRSAEFLVSKGGLSSRIENSNSLSGLSFDYGMQYFTNIAGRTVLTLGYTGTSRSKINSNTGYYTTNYTVDDSGNEGVAFDTIYSKQGLKSKVTLPLSHSIGFTLSRSNKWLLGADLNYSNWSAYREGNFNPKLNNSYGVAIGAQITPDVTAVSNYLKIIDYRVGFKYDKTYINLGNSDINQTSLTVGLGLPLSSTNRSTFYKINIGAELGQRGTLTANLVRERFANIYLGFTINDRWFQKYKFD